MEGGGVETDLFLYLVFAANFISVCVDQCVRVRERACVCVYITCLSSSNQYHFDHDTAPGKINITLPSSMNDLFQNNSTEGVMENGHNGNHQQMSSQRASIRMARYLETWGADTPFSTGSVAPIPRGIGISVSIAVTSLFSPSATPVIVHADCWLILTQLSFLLIVPRSFTNICTSFVPSKN